MTRKLAAAAGVFLSSMALLLLGMDRNAFGILDEGVIVYGAERLLGGEMQYRDFWSVYSPGQFWVVAALFKLFGASLLVERAWDVVVRACIALLSYLIAARLASPALAVIAWLISLGWLRVVGFYGYPLLPATLFALLAALLFIRFALDPGKKAMLVLCGIATALAAGFRHDVGFYVFSCVAVSLIVLWVTTRSLDLGPSLARLLSGVLVAGLPIALYLLLNVPFQDLWSQLIVFPATVYPSVRSIPYPSALDYVFTLVDVAAGVGRSNAVSDLFYLLPFFFPFMALAAAMFVLARTWRGGDAQGFERGRWIALLLLAALALTLFLASLVRPHQVHLIHVVVISVVVAVVVLGPSRALLPKPAVVLVGLVLVAMAVHPLAQTVKEIARGTLARPGGDAGPPRAGGLRIPGDQAMAIQYVRERVPKTERIFVGNGRHDIALISDVMFYFLAERGSATKFHELHPGLTTTAEVQRRIVDDLIAKRVNYVVMYTGADYVREPNKSAQSTGVWILDEFLSHTYFEEARFGRYIVRRKR